MKSKLTLGKDALILATMTLITIASWVAFDVYRTSRKTTINEATQEQMKPLDPKIDKEIINSLK